MKILILQSNGLNEKNRHFKECFNFKRSFDRLGVESFIWGPGHELYSQNFTDVVNNCDIILLLENYGWSKWLPDLSKINKLKLFWSEDSHINSVLNDHINLVRNHKIDIVLNAIEEHQTYFNFTKTEYLPYALSSDNIHPIESVKKEHFLVFCGSLLPNRVIILNKLQQLYNIKRDIFVIGNDMVNTINSYKVHFNLTLSPIAMNFRVFETMGCNTLILTNETNDYKKLFKDMDDSVSYKNESELLYKIHLLMENENLIYQIAKRGYEKVITNHTYDIRAKQLINIFES